MRDMVTAVEPFQKGLTFFSNFLTQGNRSEITTTLSIKKKFNRPTVVSVATAVFFNGLFLNKTPLF